MIETIELTKQQTKDMEHSLIELRRALFKSKDELSHTRELKLRKLLTYAKKNSSWYRKQLADIDTESFTENQLSLLPVLTKEILMANWNEIVTVPELSLSLAENHLEKMQDDEDLLYLLEHYHVIATSGSSGKRGIFIYNWDEWNIYYAMFRRYRLLNIQQLPIALNATRKIVIGVVAASSAVHGMYSLARTYKTRNSETFHFPITLPILDVVAGLNSIQPHVLQGSPTTLFRVCQAIKDNNLQISPKIISVGGEPLYPIIREKLEAIWPTASIFNNYGSSEGLAGLTCTANRKEMHLNDDLCIVEPINHFGNQVSLGEVSSKIYFTNLFNFTLPLIRYEMSDSLHFLNKECDCGVKHQLIAEPQSRFEHLFVYPDDIQVHPAIFLSPLLQSKNIEEYKVIQTINGADINILTKGPVNTEKLSTIIRERLIQQGLYSPTIRVIEVKRFDYLISGKMNRFVRLDKYTS